jgi:hypothetical protein
MIRVVIISGVCFTVGNIIWPFFDEPKLFFVPLAIFISSAVWCVKSSVDIGSKWIHLLLSYLLLLSYGNIIKQMFYTDNIKQINDYIWGGLVTVWLLYKIKKYLYGRPTALSLARNNAGA